MNNSVGPRPTTASTAVGNAPAAAHLQQQQERQQQQEPQDQAPRKPARPPAERAVRKTLIMRAGTGDDNLPVSVSAPRGMDHSCVSAVAMPCNGHAAVFA